MAVAAEKFTPSTAPKSTQPTRHVDALRPHPDNPRDDVREDDPRILEMAASIIRYGVIEPLVVSPDNVVYAGHRRRVASRVAFKQTGDKRYLTVPVVVNDTPPEAALELMLQENMQRESLTPLEEARAMHAIMERKGLTVTDLSRHLELPPPTISSRLSILRLRPEVQLLYAANELPLGAAPLLARVASAEKQVSYAGLLARRQITLAEFKKKVEPDLAPLAPDSTTLGEPEGPRPARTRSAPVPVASYGSQKYKAGRQNTPAVGPSRLNPTRGEAVASLSKALGRKVSFVSIKSVLEGVCCSCGMGGQEEVCRSCPLPRLILGIVGRAEGAPPKPAGRFDEEDGD